MNLVQMIEFVVPDVDDELKSKLKGKLHFAPQFVQDYRERGSFNGHGKDRKQEASFKSQLAWIFKSTLSAPQMKLLFHPTTGINREMGKFERISFLEAQNN
ncbi:unnamed protein product [Malus baccata var. baccata]